MDEVVRVFVDPRVIRCHVVRDEIEQQLQSALLQPLSQACERRGAAEIAMDGVIIIWMANPEPPMSSSVRSGSVAANS
jgi:hypothetical protein